MSVEIVHTVEVYGREDGVYVFADQALAKAFEDVVNQGVPASARPACIYTKQTVCDDETTAALIAGERGHQDTCSECDGSLDDGEGHDGRCGSCADEAENAAAAERRRQLAADILTTAVEGGINYWSCVSDLDRTEDLSLVAVTIHEELEDDTDADSIGSSHPFNRGHYKAAGVRVTAEDILKTLTRIAAGEINGPRDLAQQIIDDPEDVDYDASDADSIVQIAVLGEITYG